MFTAFWDMHSGGGTKVPPYERIYIEAPENEAKVIFYNRFGRSPERVTCTCCGEDYSIEQYETIEDAINYERNDSYSEWRGLTLERFLAHPLVLLIRADDIKPEERLGDLPAEGYVWVE